MVVRSVQDPESQAWATVSSQTPHPHPRRSPFLSLRDEGNPVGWCEVTEDLCSCLDQGSQTLLGSYPISLSRGGRHSRLWCLLAMHTCTERPRATKRGVWRAQAGPSKGLRVPGCDLEQTTAGLCPHTAPGSGCRGSRCARGRRSPPPRLARSQERPGWL